MLNFFILKMVYFSGVRKKERKKKDGKEGSKKVSYEEERKEGSNEKEVRKKDGKEGEGSKENEERKEGEGRKDERKEGSKERK